MPLLIRDASLNTIHKISLKIPEFENPYPLETYKVRLTGVQHKALVAEMNGELVGFKVAYALSDNTLYTWLGAVLPEYRQQGIASALAKTQEEWAREMGYVFITLKTRNIHKRMLIFALKNHFQISAVERREKIEDYRIHLIKDLSST